MLLGKILAVAAMKENKFVTWLPAYGAEVRGGTAYCMTTISDSEIGSPYIDKADTLIIMNSPSLKRFADRIEAKGRMILNTSLADRINDKNILAAYPFTDIAVELGSVKVANMVALGCLLAGGKIVNTDTVLKVIEEIAPADKKEMVEINKKALLKGTELIYGKN